MTESSNNGCHHVICKKKEGFCEFMEFDRPCRCVGAYNELEELRAALR